MPKQSLNAGGGGSGGDGGDGGTYGGGGALGGGGSIGGTGDSGARWIIVEEQILDKMDNLDNLEDMEVQEGKVSMEQDGLGDLVQILILLKVVGKYMETMMLLSPLLDNKEETN